MNILITGAKGFVGRNLCAALRNIRDGKDKTTGLDPNLMLYEYDIDTDPALLAGYCAQADFVFNLAGVNRPIDPAEFMAGNFDFASTLLDTLKSCGNTCPVMLSSSIQAEYNNPYGRSKKAGEDLFFAYSEETGAEVLVYRLQNLFGKWCRPNYNSVTATFCYNVARGLPITVNDPTVILTLVYIDDLVAELLRALSGKPNLEDDGFCHVEVIHTITLGKLAELIQSFGTFRGTLEVPDMGDAFVSKLYATYLSYLQENNFSYPLKMNVDARGSFTEIIRTPERGQFSVNVSHPGIVKGNHWHNTKNEKFLVVSGRGVIRFRKPGEANIYEYHVDGSRHEVVEIPVGYTHNIENTGDTDLVTFMWASECFNPNKPDTYFEEV
jgi:Nucleoside-diphosphate-sugar epimerases